MGDLNINRPTTRPDIVPLSSVRDNGTAASFLSLKGANPVDDGDSRESGRRTLVRSVVGHRESEWKRCVGGGADHVSLRLFGAGDTDWINTRLLKHRIVKAAISVLRQISLTLCGSHHAPLNGSNAAKEMM